MDGWVGHVWREVEALTVRDSNTYQQSTWIATLVSQHRFERTPPDSTSCQVSFSLHLFDFYAAHFVASANSYKDLIYQALILSGLSLRRFQDLFFQALIRQVIQSFYKGTLAIIPDFSGFDFSDLIFRPALEHSIRSFLLTRL